jgi:TRAP transporter TAXI family solute receptor
MFNIKGTKLGCLLLMFCLPLLAACGGASPPAAAAETLNIYLVGATPAGGGVWDLVGAGLAEAIMRSNKGSSVTVTPGGGVSDVPVVNSGEAELGLTHSVIAAAGTKGLAPFAESYDNIAGVAALYPSHLQIIVNPDLGLASLQDLKDKKLKIRIAVGDPGSTGELATRRALEGYGITYEDIAAWGGKVEFKDMGEAAVMYGDGIVDCFTLLTLAPAGPLQEVATNRKVAMLPLSYEVIKHMEGKYGYSREVLPAGVYKFLTGDVPTAGSYAVLIAGKDRPEQEIYQVTKGLLENIDYIRSLHNNLKDLEPKNMLETGIELHPGARRAFEEAGVL